MYCSSVIYAPPVGSMVWVGAVKFFEIIILERAGFCGSSMQCPSDNYTSSDWEAVASSQALGETLLACFFLLWFLCFVCHGCCYLEALQRVLLGSMHCISINYTSAQLGNKVWVETIKVFYVIFLCLHPQIFILAVVCFLSLLAYVSMPFIVTLTL